jgi:hypothetical protein
MQEGYFSHEEIQELKKEYLTTDKEKEMITTAQVWKQEGRQEKGHLVVLKGIHKNVSYVTLSDLTDISLDHIAKLAKGYEAIKEAWLLQSGINFKALISATKLTKEEVEYVIQCLENKI